ncbi:MAG: hypothetical protein PUK66_07085 [Bacteroidales bacterium]|uniref:hypothetical protein n=1 Tax=Porphyromonas sp. TaxID=1924944 RepID=UPI0029795399|nr:hypothetical protein [Porphyromonas sp.]MDD7438575.1 hypothetical protein [Bacteroidales bacterium]MDY3067832.1 hypothetical protein [Porphyromonas sp.]
MPTLINNVDINAKGIYLAKRGAEELVTLPSLSKAETNDWQELDGVQVDFSTVERTNPEVVVRYVVTSLSARTDLERYHKADHITLAPHGWGRTFTLRRPRPDSCKMYGKVGGEMALEISYRYELDDLPSERVEGGVDPLPLRSQYKLGGAQFSQFGVAVNSVDMLFSPDGYKDLTFTRQGREVQLQCILLASSWSRLWANRSALWQALQGELSLTTPLGMLRARYLSCATTKQIGKSPLISITLNIQLI